MPVPSEARRPLQHAVAIQCSAHRDRSGDAAAPPSIPLTAQSNTTPSENPIVMRTRDIDLDVPARRMPLPPSLPPDIPSGQ